MLWHVILPICNSYFCDSGSELELGSSGKIVISRRLQPKSVGRLLSALLHSGPAKYLDFDTENDVIAFRIGGEEADFVRVSITRDHKDGWLSANVEIAVGKFRGRYAADFNTFAFSEFAKQLATLHQTLSGSAKFTSLEGQLELTLNCDALGHISVSGEAMDVAGTGNRLLFDLDIDQTHVPEILNNLKATLKKHPVRHF